MPSIWDLLPASAWPVQPIVWPLDPMLPPAGPQNVSQSASSAPAFGWAPAAAASAPVFGWASASHAPPNAPAYSEATDPDAFLGAFPHDEVDPARTAQLAEDARRAYQFALWAFGPPSRPAGQTRKLAAGLDASANRFAPPAVAADAVDAPISGTDHVASRPGTTDVPVPANWADQWGAPVGNADAASVGAVSDRRAPMVAPLDQDPIAATPPARPSAQARYRRAQAGDESFAPQFVRTRPTWPESVIDGLDDTGRLMTTPPLPRPAGSYEDDAGFTHQGNADRQAWEAFVADQEARADLGPRTAIDILTGGAGFARRSALGAGGGGLRRPPTKGQLSPRIPNRPLDSIAPRPPDEPLLRDRGPPGPQSKTAPEPGAQSEPLAEPHPAPPAETVAEPSVGPSHIEDFRARINVPTLHTVAVGRTNVPGLEGITLEGASPGVWKEARQPIPPPGKYDSPSSLARDRRHAEGGIFNRFDQEVQERGLRPSDIEGKLVIHVSNPKGVCPSCRSGLDNPKARAGIIKQFSTDYPQLTIEFSVATEPEIRIMGPSRFTIRDGKYISRSDR